MNKLLQSEIDALSPEEAEYLFQILGDDTGKSYMGLWAQDYDEIPVPIEQFITDPRYLGSSLMLEDGNSILYKYWEKKISEIWSKDSGIWEVALSGCLSEDTKIPLLNGENPTIKELYKRYKSGEKLEVYSFDDRINEYTVGTVSDVIYTGNKKVYRITLDNGEHLDLTSDHLIMMRDKKWKSIDKGLSVGDSLMPFNRSVDCKGYEIIQHPQKNGKFKSEPTHRMSIRSKGVISKGVTHHKNFKKRDNSTWNLLRCSWKNHRDYHKRLGGLQFENYNSKVRIEGTPERQQMLGNQKRRLYLRWSDKNQRLEAANKMSYLNKGIIKQRVKEFYASEEGIIKRQEFSKRRINYNKTEHPNLLTQTIEEVIKALSQVYNYHKAADVLGISSCGLDNLLKKYNIDPFEYIKECPIPLPNKYYGPLLSQYNSIYNKNGEITDEIFKIKYPKRKKPSSVIKEFFNGNEKEFLECVVNYNHKIISIEEIGYTDVFDLTVDKYHNFAVESGIVVHNCIGSGKSTIAVICMAYLLYKLLCLKNPTDYYKLTKGSKITLAFFNLGLDQVYNVAFSKLQNYLKQSPWFLEHGKLWGRTNKTYYPGKGITIVCGSAMEHFIGRDIFCLFGDTLIKTESGNIPIKDLVGTEIKVYTSEGKLTEIPLKVIESKIVTELVELEMEDGTIIKCTPEHRFMLKDGSYKEAQYLDENDDLAEVIL